MRIGISCMKYGAGDYGGTQTFLRSYIEALSKIDKSDNEYILIFDKNISLDRINRSENFTSFIIETEQEINVFYRILKRLFNYTVFYQYLPLYYSEKISKQLFDLNLDVLHFPTTTIDVPFDLPIECKKIITFHDLQHEFYPKFFPKDELKFRNENYKKSLDIADKIVAISDYTANTIIEKYKISSSKICTIYESYSNVYNKSIDENKFNSVKKKYNLPDSFIFYPGNPWPHKNHLRLFEALIVLYQNQEICFSVPLVVSGILEGYQKIINDYVKQLKFPKDMIIDIGFISEEDMPIIYNFSNMLVYPSLFEGFGIPLIEAMVSNCPIVCSDVTSIPEICKNAAVYIDPNNINSIADGIYEIYSNDELRQKLKKIGSIQAKKFEWENIIPKYTDVYQETYDQKKKL